MLLKGLRYYTNGRDILLEYFSNSIKSYPILLRIMNYQGIENKFCRRKKYKPYFDFVQTRQI